MTEDDRSAVSATLSTEAVVHSAPRATEIVVVERRWLTRFPIPLDRSLTVGRSERCDIVLKDPGASRRHAMVHVAGGGLSIEDLGSRNGTRLRGAPLAPRQRTPLRVGDTIQIGGAVLLVQHGARASDARRASAVVRRECATEGIMLADGPMRSVYAVIDRIAPSTVTVLVVGETGVGKEIVVEAIHRASGRRSARPLVRINCAALPGALLESELFGHERGAFTGAFAGKQGLLEVADGGTVFLDEIGELPLSAQPKLLRVLEAHEIMPVGGVRPKTIDIRVVAATNRDLRAEVARGTFREDLYYRLNGACITVPPLRERPGDIEPLARHFVDAFCRRLGRPAPTLTPGLLDRLRAHRWPGNVRELRNAMEWALLQTSDGAIGAHHLPAQVGGEVELRTQPARPALGESMMPTVPPPRPLTDLQLAERQRIVEALAACHGNQTRAAERLHMPRRTFVAKLAAYGIPRPRTPR